SVPRVTRDNRLGVEGLISGFRRGESGGQFGFQSLEPLRFDAFPIAADEVAHILADILVSTVIANIPGDEFAQGAAYANIQGHGSGHDDSLKVLVIKIRDIVDKASIAGRTGTVEVGVSRSG